MMARFRPVVAIIFALCSIFGGANSAQYLGKFLGKLSELHHGVSGEVYAVDGRTLHIKDFTYDGQGPAAYFYASTTKAANSAGFRLRDETGSGEVIRRYRKEGVTLTLPEGKSLNNIKIFYVWCEEFAVNFGDVKIPRNFDFPRPQKIDPLKGVHDISSDNIVIVDAQTLLIPNLSYDGGAPDAKFWVGRGPKPSPQGIRVPDENGKEIPLRRYDRKTVVLTLPGDLTVFDIGHFGIWCEAFTVDFGHVQIPQNINIPPSLKMLGVSPQSKLNCEVLFDDLAFEVRWAVAGESIVLQLVSKLENREYMSFGVSGDQSKSVMIGGDVVVAWVDKTTLKGYAEDYYLDDKSQCSGPTGSCPDNRLAENTNNIRLLNAAMVNGYSIVTYQRPLKASDEFDKPILTNKTQAVIWAIGPLNQRNEVSFHSQYTKGNKFLDFGRPAKWNCPMPENEQPPMRAVATQSRQKIVQDPPATSTTQATPSRSRNNERRRGGSRRTTEAPVTSDDSERSATRTRQQTERRGGNRGGSRGSSTAVRAVPTPAPVSKRNAWNIPPIQCYEPEDGVFYAQMGPTGGKRGYPAITGHVGWGISWYINGLLIPEINVVRGKTYTFVVEGGFDPEVPAKYHPFYITDDSVGGYEYKTPEEKKNIKIFAGVRKGKDGSVVPVGTGRLCHWTQQGDLDADDFESFGAYQRTLELKCDQGEPGVIQWTPDRNTPNTVYYQCFTHRYLGWKINVLDSCDEQPASSELDSVIVPAPSDKSDLEESPSVRIETRVKPNNINNEDKEDNKASKSTVSERKTNPNLDPSQLDGQPEIPKEPILFHQPQQSLYNTFYGPQFAQNTYNPYAFENPFDHHYYEHTFKPSTALSYVNEDTTLIVPTSTTTSSTTARTTTAKPISSSAAPKLHEKFVGAAAENLPSNQHFLPPVVKAPPKFNKMTIRRPLGPGFANRPPPFHFQIKAPMRQPPPLRPFPPQMFKKPIYRPMKQRPFFKIENNPMFFSGSQPKRPPITPPNFLVLKPQIIPSPPPIKPTELIQTPEVKHVEISPQQASTEREPEIQTAASAIVSSVAPPLNQYQMIRMRPAYNTGFKPETVVIEGGFKPIMSREFRERIDDDEPELEYESEIGVINIDSGKKLEKKAVPEHFEPIFIPSPTDKPLKQKYVKVFKRPLKKSNLRIIFKEPRSLEESADLEPVAEAAERVDTYYLPPLDKTKAPIEFPQQRSNIDIETPTNLNIDSPPDVVVTYDGKKVSGASLTARLADRSSVLDMRGSKAAEFIKARPQSVPYKGELPQFIPEFLKNAPQLQSRGVLHRDLNTPSLPVRSGITKLTRVDNLKVASRRKRFAHHTPEHTAEQERQRSNSSSTQKNSSSNLFISVYAQYSLMMVALCLIKYL